MLRLLQTEFSPSLHIVPPPVLKPPPPPPMCEPDPVPEDRLPQACARGLETEAQMKSMRIPGEVLVKQLLDPEVYRTCDVC